MTLFSAISMVARKNWVHFGWLSTNALFSQIMAFKLLVVRVFLITSQSTSTKNPRYLNYRRFPRTSSSFHNPNSVIFLGPGSQNDDNMRKAQTLCIALLGVKNYHLQKQVTGTVVLNILSMKVFKE